ncbi:MAG TPA: alpha/beta hydrolase [Caulobacteraceae bacterium]|nr:alpha/beta hydrolase [Caulobacteraceae bacterium]
MASFRSGGLRLAYDDIRPAGKLSGTVLLVHGFATNRAENWKRLGWYAAFERRGYRVVAPDLRGHGMSDKPHDPAAYRRAEMSGDILSLMDHLRLGRIELMGYSLGAHLAMAAAIEEPGRIANLILGGVGGRLFGQETLPPSTMTLSQAMRAEDVAAITDPILRGFRQFADNQGEDRLALAACGEGGGGEAVAEVSGLTMPVVVIAGDRDQIAGNPQILADTIPGARAITLPACDHFSAIPHALFKAAVFDFLDGWPEEM